MCDDYKMNNPDANFHYELYRRMISDMNISFTKLGHEECDFCMKFEHHHPEHNEKNLCPSCDMCIKWVAHMKRAEIARDLYRIDAQSSKSVSEKDNPSTKFFCADMQKVIMLPHIPSSKTTLFTQRIVAFHLSVVPLGQLSSSSKKPFAVVWHEGVAGRKAEDIASAYHSFFMSERDVKTIIIWLDNCTAQNKNWTFISSLVELINSDVVETDLIELNYFEPGHTFMSADSFHHQVELSMKKMKNAYDFHDFEMAVQNANSGNVIVKPLNYLDFKIWKDFSSTSRLSKVKDRHHLSEMKKIQFRRGEHKIFFTVDYAERGREIFHELDFLQIRVINKGFPPAAPRLQPRGIPLKKKEDIIKKLLPLMPQSRRSFWLNIETSDVPDLAQNYDNGEIELL
ncbi:hypothetical protein QAD02_018104 [Eretmocerus hayati]|uniref:Uncharacterized protein n=1 Tax=Eretmocerus hayati TaxID=131215 RepID=A0ACC2PG53_9HYME|nr:hypothetical protein QAD02_018104 [Eretmocerus hayati]